MNTRITGTGYSLPAFRADNDYLATLVETSDEWITERTGIRARHLAGEETTVSMAAAAAEKALKRAGADPSEVELLIVATISGDTVTPSTACRVQALIGADKAVAFDINAACSGFLYALHMADACVKSGMYKNALLIGAETLSKLVASYLEMGQVRHSWKLRKKPEFWHMRLAVMDPDGKYFPVREDLTAIQSARQKVRKAFCR